MLPVFGLEKIETVLPNKFQPPPRAVHPRNDNSPLLNLLVVLELRRRSPESLHFEVVVDFEWAVVEVVLLEDFVVLVFVLDVV